MNPNSISHRLFIAALRPSDPTPGKHPAAARSLGVNGATKANAAKSAQSFSALAARRDAAWSWSGWEHNTT